MAVTLIEKPERSGDSSPTTGSGRWVYTARVTGEANPETALIAAIIADTGYFWYNLAVRRVSFNEIGGDLYTATVDWEYEVPDGAAQDPTDTPGPTDGPGGTAPSGTPSGPSSESDPIGPNHTFEIGGRPPKLYTSRRVVEKEKAGGGNPRDNGLFLNVDPGEKKPEGLEIDDPASVWTVEIKFDRLTVGYLRRLSGAVWCANSDPWYHFEAYELAFLGASFQSSQSGRWTGTFRFGVRMNEVIRAKSLRDEVGKNLPTADVDKSGWDYLEIEHETVTDAAAGVVVSRPAAFRIHEVLPPFDYTLFGIGG